MTLAPPAPKPPIRRIRNVIFLKDVLWLALTCFGGPQVHLVMFLKTFVEKRRYLTEDELLELQALCQILPGPTSTQTITALGFRIGGPTLAYLTLFVWGFPAVCIMTMAAIGIHLLEEQQIPLNFIRFVEPMAVAFLAYGGIKFAQKVIDSKAQWTILIIASVIAYVFRSPYMTPIVVFLGGLVTSFRYRRLQKMEKYPIRIEWGNFILWLTVLVLAAAAGVVTQALPIRLFENFYRNGSLVFGGGQVLSPILYTEFVEFKQYLTRQEFLSGMALSQVVPGPVFSMSSYIGALSMRAHGLGGQLLGSIMATSGIFLPGTFLIFFVYRFWNELKRYRGIRASLAGLNAASVGLTIAAVARMSVPVMGDTTAILTLAVTLLLLFYSKIPPFFIILTGLVLGFVI